jgi:hypothetical protein
MSAVDTRCRACWGDRKCAECSGTGTNVHLNESEPKCRNCSGTGVCPRCGGTGSTVSRGPEIIDLGI